jgi:5-oxoprolinase (ATP-hydrolysing) subunit A
MALRGRVATLNGGEIELAADTICIHGDTPGAVDLARIVRGALEANGVAVKPLADVLQRRQQPDSGELLVTRERLQP